LTSGLCLLFVVGWGGGDSVRVEGVGGLWLFVGWFVACLKFLRRWGAGGVVASIVFLVVLSSACGLDSCAKFSRLGVWSAGRVCAWVFVFLWACAVVVARRVRFFVFGGGRPRRSRPSAVEAALAFSPSLPGPLHVTTYAHGCFGIS